MGSRPLTAGEKALAQSIFGNNIDYDQVVIHDEKHNPFQNDNTVTAPNGEIYYPSGHSGYLPDISQGTPGQKALFLHEMTHILQDHNGMDVILERLNDGGNYNYDGIFSGTPFSDLPMEAQADFLRDYYLEKNGVDVNPDWDASDFEQYLPKELPNGNPNGDTLDNLETPPVPSGNADLPLDLQDVQDTYPASKDVPSPLVLDLDGNGIELAALSGTGSVYWDSDVDGFAEASGWIAGGDGLLAIDVNADGIINDHSELFGDQTGYANGFLALAALDSNSDGEITSADAQFDDLLVWVDDNADGYSQATELHTLDSLGITSIDLGYSNVNYQVSGNDILQESIFTINGQTRSIVDAWFATDNMNTEYIQNYTLDDRTFYLPTLRGYGNLPDLHIAMSQDETLLNMVHDLAVLDSDELLQTQDGLQATIENILFRWAGVDGTDPESLGTYIDARRVEFLTELVGEDEQWMQFGQYTNPVDNSGALLDRAFESVLSNFGMALLVQSASRSLFSDTATYNAYTGEIENMADDFTLWFMGDHSNITGQAATQFVPGQPSTAENDFYLHNTEDTQGKVYEILDDGGDNDILAFEDGITADDIKLWHNNDGDLRILLGDNASIDYIKLIDQFSGGDNVIETALFSDGTTLDLLNNLTFSGPSSGAIVYGRDDDNVLIGIAQDSGWNQARGYAGNDTYIYNLENTRTRIYDSAGEADKILLGDNITVSDVRIAHYGTDLYIYTQPNDSNYYITAYNQFDGTGQAVETLEFSDGTTLDLVNNPTFVGTDNNDNLQGLFDYDESLRGGLGNDSLQGLSGNDTLYADQGVDNLYGGEGADIFAFETAMVFDGVDAIADFSLNDGDAIDITDVLSGYYDPSTDDITDFVQITDNGYTSTLKIDQDGGADNFVAVATLTGITGLTDEQNLMDTGYLLFRESGNASPVEAIDAFTGNEDAQITGNLLADNGNGVDSDADAHSLSVQAKTIATAQGGSVTVAANGNFTYTPASDYNGEDSFEYILLDGHGGRTIGLATLMLSPVNDAPVAINDDFVGPEDQQITGNVLANNGNGADSDVESDPLSVQAGTYTTAQSGSITISANGDFVYTPGSGFTGDDSFTYTLLDGQGGSDTASIDLHVYDVTYSYLSGTASGEYIYGSSNFDIIDGKAGNDYIYGYEGDDAYVWNIGDGNDYIYDSAGIADVIEFGAGITADDVRLWNPNNGNLQIYIGSENITINDQFDGTGEVIEIALFDNGSSMDLMNSIPIKGTSAGEYVRGLDDDNSLYGNAGNDFLYGYDGDDLLYGGQGTDYLYGGSGNDTFAFETDDMGTGIDHIQDFSVGDDAIDLSDLLSGYDPISDAITDFVWMVNAGVNTDVYVDLDGTGTSEAWTHITTIHNITGLTDEDAQVSNGTLITV